MQKLPADAEIRALECSGENLWAGTTAGLAEISKSGERLFTAKDGLADSRVLCLSHSRDGSLWIGTRNGFSRLRNGVKSKATVRKEGLSQSTCFRSIRRRGRKPVGGHQKRAESIRQRAGAAVHGERRTAEQRNRVRWLQDSRGDIWIGTLGAGLARFDGKRFTPLTCKQRAGVEHDLHAGRGRRRRAVGRNHVRASTVCATGSSSRIIRPGRGCRRPMNSGRCSSRVTGCCGSGTETGRACSRTRTLRSRGTFRPDLRGPMLAIGEDATASNLFRDGRRAIRLLGTQEAPKNCFKTARSIARRGRVLSRIATDLLWIGTLGRRPDGCCDHGKLTTFPDARRTVRQRDLRHHARRSGPAVDGVQQRYFFR